MQPKASLCLNDQKLCSVWELNWINGSVEASYSHTYHRGTVQDTAHSFYSEITIQLQFSFSDLSLFSHSLYNSNSAAVQVQQALGNLYQINRLL